MYCSNVDDMPDCSRDAQRLRRGYPIDGVYYSMEDLIAKYNVQLYLTAHEHSYERTWPVLRGDIDWSQNNHSYSNAKYPVHIIAGSAGCEEGFDGFDDVFFGPWSVIRSASYGYAHLIIYNSTHLHWSQTLDEGRAGTDDLWLIQTAEHAERPPRDDIKLYQGNTHASSICDEYCFHVCSQHNARSSCAVQCSCEAEEARGAPIGAGVRVKRSKLLKHR